MGPRSLLRCRLLRCRKTNGDRGKLRESDYVNEKPLQLKIDESHCTKCGLCEERAPENMEMSDDGPYAQVIKQPVGDSETANCIEAVEYCPTGGLTAMAINPDPDPEENTA